MANNMSMTNYKKIAVMLNDINKQFNIQIVVLIVGIIFTFVENVTMINYDYYYDDEGGNRLPCHVDTYTKDLLHSIDEFTPDENSIFFHETSCKGYLSARQACAIEAAALVHRHRPVYVIFNGPIRNLTNLRLVNLIPNVHCVRIHLNYSREILGNDTMNKLYFLSDYPVLHAADIFRFITMYKWGGTYLDLDMMVIKPLDELGQNWVIAEYNDELSTGAMDFSHDTTGLHAVKMVIDEIKKTYDPSFYNHNGNGALTRTFTRLCNVSTQNIFQHDCNGFNIYDPAYFYPIHWDEAEKYFLRNFDLQSEIVHQAYAHHMWNWLTHKMKIEDGSFYADLALRFCPNIYVAYREEFGRESLIY